ncbi:M20 aminoacylase family protein [Rhodobacter capsulatus]|jgi:hippurate hydrolase|uniref:Peptidase, M20 family, amidohydrolase n=1 Tax=Rhodobacter capsulatus (strain ATCC BAA-309 / NBRC 16581 / SB1003) TaxID=272942 RepID=D5AU86_RHOCB|nr:M20 aminoacylase family protein [Rhodobacter capsulatus]ADE85525.1 peptidase, M20 family, amidohydrolase [Rhodobacter capsulatus SB 1003]ETD01559.1 amidohydrolase [Rhodobacter capsulatus DE442]ETD76626.1 amidohydrolase [Rhodobacter capsulatus R121]ETE53462.1 amidohydrolase [Rhodobacter capsulatus Y262]MDS0927237.1 M20 family metallopeptidase [Rhodobacter capsulatus]
MPVINRIAALAPEMKEWRQWLHRHPELEFQLPKTAAYVAERLREIGVDEIHEGIATSGIVALIKGRQDGPVIGLRADMDALPIDEITGVDYASEHDGKMHACGHDGHTAMLLGAAKYLAETRNFAGTVALLFQPAEEDGGGGEVMVREGVMERFAITEVYGIHNAPNLPFGHFHTTQGALMAAVDTAWVTVTGRGGHGATPHECIDPIPAITAMVGSLQTIVSRNLFAMDELVVSVTQIHVGTANNIIPETGWFCATIRSFTPEVRAMVERRFHEIVEGTAAAFGVSVEIRYDKGYPPTINDGDKARFAAEVAREVSGPEAVKDDAGREMGAEDFSYMLEARPGAYLFLGTGPGAGLHHPAFDFNDEAAPIGASFFARLVERALPAR